MREITKRLTNFIKTTQKAIDPETNETIGGSIFEDVSNKYRNDIQEEVIEEFPEIIEGEKEEQKISNKNITKFTTVQYRVKKDMTQKVKKSLGDIHMSNKKMGLETYNYYIDLEGVEDE